MSSPATLPPSTPSSPAAATPGDWWAVCLCAAWCGTCGIYRPLFDELARAHPEVRFEWVDIEDESDLAGDLDVETLRALEDALLEFAGSIMVISHDRWFLDRIATHILAAEGDSQWVFFNGNYQEYEADKKQRLGEEGAAPKRPRFKSLA